MIGKGMFNYKVSMIILFGLFVALFFSESLYKADSGKQVLFVPVEKTVEQGLEAFIKRSIQTAEQEGVEHIVLEIHTPGGAVDAATEIAKLIRNTEIPITAFINNKAISAGAYIALNADEIVMVPHSTMGSAAIIDLEGNTAGKKAETYWKAEMRAAAELNGRDPKYALAMVDVDLDLPEYGAGKGDLLTLTAEQALEVGYTEAIVDSRQGLLKHLNLSNAKIVEMEVSFAEKLARFITNPIVVPILLSIGSLGLVMELYSPGFGIPGSMGLGALILFFYGHMVAGLAGWESILLLIIGIILIVIELFVPGGIIGLIGIASIVVSLLLSTNDIGHMAMSILIAIIVTVVASILMFKFFGIEKGFFRHIILSDSTSSEKGYVSNQNRPELVGQEGITVTPLRPSGTAIFAAERLDVVSEGSFIASNKKVQIIKVEGSRVMVRELFKTEEEK